MNPELVLLLVRGTMAIIRRHATEHDGEILSDEQVHEALLEELSDGQSTIARWFAEQGLPLPD